MNAAVMPRTLVALDGAELARALRTGIRRLLQQQEYINKINVFPVPDGDTGTNMALTMHAVLGQLREPRAHAGQLLTRVADAALDGARGNSGAIMAQFFLGVGDRAGHLAELTAADLADAVEGGAKYARDAMSEPREGTLLTVLAELAVALREQVARGGGDLLTVLRGGLRRAEEATTRTTQQLEHLRKANVVDAGAQGFVEILTGMVDYVATGAEPEDLLPAVVQHDAESSAGEVADLTHRYCTECFVTGLTPDGPVDRRALRETLSTLGSSLVVAGHDRKVKVHIHVNDPDQVFRAAEAFGRVEGQKADDMQRQQESAHHAQRQQVAVATDSAADIPEAWLEQYDIHVVPVRVHIGTHSYLDKVSLDAESFFRQLAEGTVSPKTSQPPPGDFRRLFEFLASHYTAVVSVNLTRANSGTLGAAETAAARVSARGGVHVVDTRNASCGQGLLALAAAERAAAGGTAAEVIAHVERLRPYTHTFACPTTLKFAVQGGRIPPWAGRVATWLRMTPLICSHLHGKVGIGGVLFGRQNLIAQFARWAGRRIDPRLRYRVLIGHGMAEANARALLARLRESHANLTSGEVVPIGTALGVHGGPGLLVIGLQVLPDDLEAAERLIPVKVS